MSDDKTPVEQALDLLVYAPLGFALSLREELPKLAERGRQHATNQTTMAKMIGQFAVQQGQREAEKLLQRAGERAGEVLKDLRGEQASPHGAGPVGASPPADVRATAAKAKAMAAQNGQADVAPARPQPSAESLAIPGYDTLSASQVVQRLAGLTAEELAAVEDYERGGRKRRTILNRIEQLQQTG